MLTCNCLDCLKRIRITLLLAIVACPIVSAQVFTPEHLTRLREVQDAVISPDGTLVAYTLRVPRAIGVEDDGPAWVELHVVDLDGRSRPFITGTVNVSRVDWTPDSRGISFVARLRDDKHQSLYVIPRDGGESRRLVARETDVEGYAWSPDGRSLAVIAKDPEDKRRVALREKGFRQRIYEEELRSAGVFILPAEIGQTSTPAASAPASSSSPSGRRLEIDGSALSVRWSPDGALLGVKIARSPSIDDIMMFSQIHVFDAKTCERIDRVDSAGKLGDFRFSPNGQQLALITALGFHDPREGRLSIAPARGGAPVELLPGYLGHISDLAWQDNDTVMYVGLQGCGAAFCKIDLDRKNQKTIIAADAGPILQSVSLAQDGLCGAFVADSPNHPAEVFVMKHGDAAPRRLTDSNPWLRELRLAHQEVIPYRARDGLELEGILIHPLDEKPGTRYPLVLVVHGGPEQHESNGWKTTYSRCGQILAARGFAVFLPNYRGSTGRGVEFAALGQHDYGGREFDDLVDAADHLIQIGMVDKAKVGVTGGSYGGYATAWCATKLTDRFAAGVMLFGLSDKYASFGTTDIPNEMYMVHARVWPWEEPGFYYERSPVAYATQARTPLLIAHGLDDTRVHPSQSQSLYRFIKSSGQTPVRLVWYPDEGHGFAKASSRYDFTLRLVQWMEHYLKGPGGAPPPPDVSYSIEGLGSESAPATPEASNR
ncbi:MAG: S9 family peptidase [Planctomycetes bacterium]|nr:S9 family peptidase [Planctomycetota bacterium]